MAAKFAPNSPRNRRLVQRILSILAILLLTIQPGYGGGEEEEESAGGCGSGGEPVIDGLVASEVASDYATPISVTAGSYSETIDGATYVSQLLGGASNRFDPRLPGYSYFQGVIQANNHITVVGQVRIVGALLGADRENGTVSLYSGAMITTNAHAVVGAGESLTGGPDGMRTRIRKLEEIPTP